MVDGGELVSKQAYCILEKPDWNGISIGRASNKDESKIVKQQAYALAPREVKIHFIIDVHLMSTLTMIPTFTLGYFRALVPIPRSKVSVHGQNPEPYWINTLEHPTN